MALSEIEQAFAENLILLGALSGPQLIYPILTKAQDPRPLWEIVGAFNLVPPDLLQRALNTAQGALEAAGPQAFTFSEGALVGTWELVEQRGKESGGEVWLGRRNGQPGTLRVVTPGSGQDQERAQRFVERSNAGLDPPHPAVLKIDEAEEDFGWLYTATVGMDCRSLSALRAPGPVPEQTALALAQSVAGSLAVVHDLGVVHGGLTPLSVLVQDQRVYLSDFSVSAAVLDGPARGARPGGRLGLLLYASPGLIAGDAVRGLDARDDLYSLGALVLHAVTSVGPGDQRAAPGAPWLVTPPVSAGLQAVLARLLSPDPNSSYVSARALLEDLGRVASGGQPGPLPAGDPVRGRRADNAEPQTVVHAEIYNTFATPSESARNLAVAPAPEPEAERIGSTVADPMGLEPEEPYEEDDYEEEPARKPIAAPKARSSRLELTSAPPRKKGGGWLLLLFTLIVMIGGGATAYGVLQPVGVDLARAHLESAERLLEVPAPQYAQAKQLLDEAIELAAEDPRVVQDALLVLETIERKSRAERAALAPEGLETPVEALANKRKQLDDLSTRARGLTAGYLASFDMARADKEENVHTWGDLADALLSGGVLIEAEYAYRKNGSKRGPRLVEYLKEHAVFLPGGPYLLPGDEGQLRMVLRESCYIDRVEVSRKRYAEFLRETGRSEKPHQHCEVSEPGDKSHDPDGWAVGDEATREHPATGVDYYDASGFAGWCGGKLPDAETYVAAARGPRGLPYPWGAGEPSPAVTNAGEALGGPVPTGCFPGGAAPCGALDLLGNVAEWVRSDAVGSGAAVFGGHYETPTSTLVSKPSDPVPVTERRRTVGFRVVYPAGLE